jgi:integrase
VLKSLFLCCVLGLSRLQPVALAAALQKGRLMASISCDPNGNRSVQFVAGDGRRRTIRLGKVTQKKAEEIKLRVERINAARIANLSLDNETAAWGAGVGDDLAAKLAAVGLIPAGQAAAAVQLGAFLDGYITRRTDVKPRTRINLDAAKARLLEFFGADKPLGDITPADADNWLLWLRERYANSTAGRTVKRAKQFFRAAVRGKLIAENPFADVKPPSQSNPSRLFFVTTEMARQVLDTCPDVEWRLLFALSRYGGLRCPSEHLALKWTDIDWGRERMRVHSPKKEHLEGGGDRWVPLFPELRAVLAEAFDLAPEGTVHVITRYRDTNSNLRTRLTRIIRRAGLTPWPKLFHNLRASRETELAAQYPLHVVCAWIGNTEMIAAKHYLQVTEDHFRRAAQSGAVALQNPVQQAAAADGTDSQETTQPRRDSGVVLSGAAPCEMVRCTKIPPRGLERAQKTPGKTTPSWSRRHRFRHTCDRGPARSSRRGVARAVAC